MAGRTPTRTWADSEVARVVDALGGVQWAAAILGTTAESIKQWLMAGTVSKDRAPVLARAALAKGVGVDLLKLLYGDAPELEPLTVGSGKKVRRKSTTA